MSEVDLINFFIFDDLKHCKEGEEHKKVLYYYPPTDEINTQINNVGLVEALIKFTGNFKPSTYVNSLHTQQKRQLYHQPEPDIWMVMTLKVPVVNNGQQDEYLDEAVQDNVYEAVLKQAYLMYKLFFGPFVREATNLKKNLHAFYMSYLPRLKLSQNDPLHSFNGISFLPLDKHNFLKISCFVNSLQNHFPAIEFMSLLYNNSVIWSSIEPEDMQVVYKYLKENLLPDQLQLEISGSSLPKHNTLSAIKSVNLGRFVMGPNFLKTLENTRTVHFNNDTYSMIIYRALSLSVCLFVNKNTDLNDKEFFKSLDEIMGPKLTLIASDVAEYCSKQMAPSNVPYGNPHLLYFNELNLAFKNVVFVNEKEVIDVESSKQAIRIMADMNSKKGVIGKVGDTIVKTVNDNWVIGRVSDLREFYASIQQKNASLIDISDEVKKLCDGEFKGIFIYPL